MFRTTPSDTCRTGEFAKLAGVTIRTLRYYDKLGLLKARRSPNGYRVYRRTDLARLEQIVALKFLGLPLPEIRGVIEAPGSLAEALARQHAALLEKRRLVDRALEAVAEARKASESGRPVAELLRKVIEVIEMSTNSNWMMKYYSLAAQAKLVERWKSFTPEDQARATQVWKDYMRDMADLKKNGDPTGTKQDELAARYRELIAAFTGNDPEIEAGLRDLYRDQANWPQDFAERMTEFKQASAGESTDQA